MKDFCSGSWVYPLVQQGLPRPQSLELDLDWRFPSGPSSRTPHCALVYPNPLFPALGAAGSPDLWEGPTGVWRQQTIVTTCIPLAIVVLVLLFLQSASTVAWYLCLLSCMAMPSPSPPTPSSTEGSGPASRDWLPVAG